MKPLKNFGPVVVLIVAQLFLSQCSRLSTSTESSSTIPTKSSLSTSDSSSSIPVGTSSDSSESSGDSSGDTDSATGITEGAEESAEDASFNEIAIGIIEFDVQASAGAPAEIK